MSESVNSTQPREVPEACAEIANVPDVLAKFEEALRQSGFVGDTRRAKLIYLSSYTRFLQKPVSIVAKGNPAAGKSHLMKTALSFVPPAAYVEFSGMSNKALQHSSEDFRHRHLVIEEYSGLQSAEGNPWLRMFLSAGKLIYATVVHVEGRGFVTQKKVKEGPTGLFMTTTEGALHPEDESRVFSFTVEDDAEQTRRVLLAQAGLMGTGRLSQPDLPPWHAFHDWIASGDKKVAIPFADELAGLVNGGNNQLKRDFPNVLSLISAHCLLHEASRERDETGALIATMEDYAAVHELVADIVAESVQASVPSQLREMYGAIVSITDPERGRVLFVDGVPQNVLSVKLGWDKGTVSRWAAIGLREEYLVDNDPRPGRPSKLIIWSPLPEGTGVLPTPEELADETEDDISVT